MIEATFKYFCVCFDHRQQCSLSCNKRISEDRNWGAYPRAKSWSIMLRLMYPFCIKRKINYRSKKIFFLKSRHFFKIKNHTSKVLKHIFILCCSLFRRGSWGWCYVRIVHPLAIWVSILVNSIHRYKSRSCLMSLSNIGVLKKDFPILVRSIFTLYSLWNYHF